MDAWRMAGVSCLLLMSLGACEVTEADPDPDAGGTAGMGGTAGTAGMGGTAGTAGMGGTAGTSGSSGMSGAAGTAGSSGTAGTGGSVDDAAADAPPSGVYTLTGVTIDPPAQPMGETWEVTYEEGLVEYHPFSNDGMMTMRFEWTNPPSEIAPGELWPISGTASVLVNDNPLGWGGTVDARDPGGSLFPLDSLGGSEVKVGSGDSVGYTVTRAAITNCPDGGADFDLHVGAPNGNKDWSADFYYHYKWNP